MLQEDEQSSINDPNLGIGSFYQTSFGQIPI
jgi:hypothetical protein